MLDPWIIHEILRREREAEHGVERPRVDLPLEPHVSPSLPTMPIHEERGVTVIDI